MAASENTMPVGDEETINGTSSSDVLAGGLENSTIIGGAGKDTIYGDTGILDDESTNGSFNEYGELSFGGWGLFRELDGWRSIGNHQIEVQRSGLLGDTSDGGDGYIELDSTGNSVVRQDFKKLEKKDLYVINFDFSARPGVIAASNTIEVVWNGKVLDTITADGLGLTNTDWTEYNFVVEAKGKNDYLEFRGVGIEDSVGGFVDDVQFGLLEQPEIGGNDMLIGGEGNDTIFGGGGRDWLVGGEGRDVLDGGDGVDTASYVDAEEGVSLSLEDGKGTEGDAKKDVLIKIENARGSNFGDYLEGDENTNRLVGADGEDQLFGLGGNDTLLGGRGADYMDGGEGDRDVAEYDWSTSGVTVNLTTGTGTGGFAEGDQLVNIEYLYGSHHDDVLIGDDGVNRLVGNCGDDVLNGMGGNDILVGGHGAETIIGGEGDRDAVDYQSVSEGVSLSLLTGGTGGFAAGDTYDGVEYVYGSQHDDSIEGDNAVNRLVGNEGDDVLSGMGGNDYILGGAGNDTMTGGAGNDVFQMASNFGDDIITDFEAGAGRTDRIWFKGMNLSEDDLVITDTIDGVLIDTGDFGTLTLTGLTADQLVSDDFIF